jgi:hypothetical protein
VQLKEPTQTGGLARRGRSGEICVEFRVFPETAQPHRQLQNNLSISLFDFSVILALPAALSRPLESFVFCGITLHDGDVFFLFLKIVIFSVISAFLGFYINIDEPFFVEITNNLYQLPSFLGEGGRW